MVFIFKSDVLSCDICGFYESPHQTGKWATVSYWHRNRVLLPEDRNSTSVLKVQKTLAEPLVNNRRFPNA
uniref:Uncharacterized protein n=1 Tax=Steinernema glaseri TaxID=37863 RepID=A0A1I7YPP3_9BILA